MISPLLHSLETYGEAQALLAELAARERSVLHQAFARERLRCLLESIGNPDRKMRCIHVAGTSGKGSTATAIACFLHGLGARVGLETSPHLSHIRERVWLEGRLISEQEVVEGMQALLPAILSLETSTKGSAGYFEVWTALGFYTFAARGITHAVIEAGIGGLRSATNVLDAATTIAVITKIGLDHTTQLGKTTARIAQEKAGIIHPENEAFAVGQTSVVERILEERSRAQQARLCMIRGREYVKNASFSPQGMTFDYVDHEGEMRGLQTPLVGPHQLENLALALAVVKRVCSRDGIAWNEERIRQTLGRLSIPGRFEIREQDGQTFVFDIAHNPQKMRSLVRTLQRVWKNRTFSFLVAFGETADHEGMLRAILGVTDHLVLADFIVEGEEYRYRFANVERLGALAEKMKFPSIRMVRDNADDALCTAQSLARGPVIVTGNTSFVGTMKKKIVG